MVTHVYVLSCDECQGKSAVKSLLGNALQTSVKHALIIMKSKEKDLNILKLKENFLNLNHELLKAGFNFGELQAATLNSNKTSVFNLFWIIGAIIAVIFCILYEYGIFEIVLKHALGIRCIIPNNYFVWEATRPISDCQFCTNVTEPIILLNITKDEFSQYAYSSKPIIIKRAFLHWPAVTVFSFEFFQNLYDKVEDAYRSVDEECQFLHFRSNFISLRDVFAMSESRIKNEPGQTPWYVGWGNCDPDVLEEMRQYYPKPHFLPDDSEIPSKEYVFMGYDAGATMHLDFINRLMWQAQLKGRKTWYLKPSPECEDVCKSMIFSVGPGDAVLIDTRVWYHGTTITPGEFSLAIQSEYG